MGARVKSWLGWLVGGALFVAMFLAASPFLNVRNPFSQDPFNYLVVDELQWAYEPWVVYNRLLAQHQGAEHPGVAASLRAYQAAAATEKSFSYRMDQWLRNVATAGPPDCFDLVYAPEGKTGFTLAYSVFEKEPSTVCLRRVTWAQLSDDGTRLAVEVRERRDDFAVSVLLFKVAPGHPPMRYHTLEDAELMRPHSFDGSGTLMYRTKSDLLLPDTPCALSTWKDGVTGCYVPKPTLPKDRELRLIHRPKQTSRVSLLLAAKGRETYDVYQFEAGDPVHFERPLATGVLGFVAQRHGFLYAKEQPAAKRYHSAQNVYRYHPGERDHALVLSVPFYQSDFSGVGMNAYVLHRDGEAGRYRLHHVGEEGVKEVPLTDDIATVHELSLARSLDLRTVRIRFETSTGVVRRGEVHADGTFVLDTVQSPPMALDIHPFEAPSADGTLVPCKLLRRSGLQGPVPTVVETYGAYGSVFVQSFTAFSAAVLSQDMGYLFTSPRGGGEHGQQWSDDGNGGRNKLKTIEDTEACLRAAISARWVLPGKVLMYGGSAGAIPAAMVALRQPELVAGARLSVPYLDSSGRHQNSWLDEQAFGALTEPDEAARRVALSPYDNLLQPSDHAGRFLFTCGAQDKIVPQWHCLKGHAAVRARQPNRQSQMMVLQRRSHLASGINSDDDLANMRVVMGFVLNTLKPVPTADPP